VVAIVGAREADGDGCDFTLELAADLATRGVVILSGLARGIDAAAHRGALEAGGLTGAVLGTSLDECSPPEHRDLQREVAASVGLLTEVPSGVSPSRVTFARRNRLLAALSRAVVVVQGRAGSGSLLTARAARALKLPVGAVPWDPREPLAEAPLELLAGREATVIRSADDVLTLIGEKPAAAEDAASAGRGRARKASPVDFESASSEGRLYRALRRLPQPLERVASQAGLNPAEAGAALVQLELSGHARREPGGRVRRIGG
jgi:DNA processing protein